MPTVTIYTDIEVDVDDVLSEIASDILVEELESRNVDFAMTEKSNDYYILKKIFYSKDVYIGTSLTSARPRITSQWISCLKTSRKGLRKTKILLPLQCDVCNS